jgi:hypothetical protein
MRKRARKVACPIIVRRAVTCGCNGWIIPTSRQILLECDLRGWIAERCIALAPATELTLFETLAGYFAIDGLIVPGSLHHA